MSAAPLPTFLIIGAQKSATRWLRLNLGLHPEVFTADHEIAFFSSERRRLGADWYATQFEGWQGEAIVGEATPAYMMYRQHPWRIARRVRQFNPEMRLMAVLRNPIDRAYSGFVHHMKAGRLPADTDMLEYVRSVRPRHDPLTLIAGGWYHASLKPFRRRFGSKLLVLLHDDIGEDSVGRVRHGAPAPRRHAGLPAAGTGGRPVQQPAAGDERPPGRERRLPAARAGATPGAVRLLPRRHRQARAHVGPRPRHVAAGGRPAQPAPEETAAAETADRER